MRRIFKIGFLFIAVIFFSSLFINPTFGEESKIKRNLDSKVRRFLESHRDQWADWNIPEADGRVLYDLIIKNNYKKAVDIGTSTGTRPFGWHGRSVKPVEDLLPSR